MKKWFFINCFFLIFINFIFSDLIDHQELEEITKLIRNNKPQQALEKLSKWSVYISSYPQIAYYIGVSHFRLKNYEEAERFFEFCLKNGYRTNEVFYNLAVTKYKLKKYKEAVEYFKNLENDFYLEPESLYISISCYLKLQDRQNALNAFKKLVSKYPYSAYVIKSQSLLDKAKIDYSPVLVRGDVSYRFIVSGGYGKDTNIGYISQQDYKNLEPSNLSDNFFHYYIYASIFNRKFYGYYRYSAKEYLTPQNLSYNHLSHTLFISQRLYKDAEISFSGKFLGNFFEYQEPYTYNLTGGLDLDFSADKNTTLQLNYSYTTNKYFSSKDYLEGPQHLIGINLNYMNKTKFNVGVSLKFKETYSDFTSSEYNYSYFILIGTITYLRNVYTPVLYNYSYNSISVEGTLEQEVLNNVSLGLDLNYEHFKYIHSYEYYTKVNDIYLLDLNEDKWFIYTQNSWFETQQPQVKKINKERFDSVFNLSTYISFRLTKNIELNLNYIYILNSSSLITFQWEKQLYQASLKVSF